MRGKSDIAFIVGFLSNKSDMLKPQLKIKTISKASELLSILFDDHTDLLAGYVRK